MKMHCPVCHNQHEHSYVTSGRCPSRGATAATPPPAPAASPLAARLRAAWEATGDPALIEGAEGVERLEGEVKGLTAELDEARFERDKVLIDAEAAAEEFAAVCRDLKVEKYRPSLPHMAGFCRGVIAGQGMALKSAAAGRDALRAERDRLREAARVALTFLDSIAPDLNDDACDGLAEVAARLETAVGSEEYRRKLDEARKADPPGESVEP